MPAAAAHVLQPGEGSYKGQHQLRTTPDTVLWGYLPNATSAPVLTVAPGDTVSVDTMSHEGLLEDQGRDPIAYFASHGVDRAAVLHDAIAIAASGMAHHWSDDGPHVVTGPIAVRGARAGDVLKVEVLDLALRTPYGVISNRHGLGALPGEFPQTSPPDAEASAAEPHRYHSVMQFAPVVQHGGRLYGTLPYGDGRRVRFPLAPFLGVMGVAPATDQPVPSVPPGPHGGNIDVNLLNVGSTLYLPVQVDEALFYVGDPHYAQGDGEVALTAMEASLRATVRVSVLRGREAHSVVGALAQPFIETDDVWVPVVLDPDLNEAFKKATRAAIAFLHETQGMEPAVALAYLSAAADFEVSQVVDAVKGVHCVIRKSDFRPW